MNRVMNDEQLKWAFEKHCEGYTFQELADALFVNVCTIKNEFKRNKLKKALVPPVYSPDEEVPVVVKFIKPRKKCPSEHEVNWAYYYHWKNHSLKSLSKAIGTAPINLQHAFKRYGLKVRFRKIERPKLVYDFRKEEEKCTTDLYNARPAKILRQLQDL